MSTVNEKMTAICDALREKSGETEKLSLDDIVRVIGELTSGGEGTEVIEYASKSYTGSTNNKTISHGLTSAPSVVVMFRYESVTSSSSSGQELLFSAYVKGQYIYAYKTSGSSTVTCRKTSSYTENYCIRAASLNITVPSNLRTGDVYYWVATR